MTTTYKIVRTYENAGISRRTITTGLTLTQAQAHCNNPDTSSRTCTTAVGRRRTREIGRWFDGYTDES